MATIYSKKYVNVYDSQYIFDCAYLDFKKRAREKEQEMGREKSIV